MAMRRPTHASPLDRGLRIFTDVRPGEGVTAVLLALNIFLILTAYYILKPVREALILSQGSAEIKSYMSAAMIVVLAVAVPFYGRLAAQLPRRPGASHDPPTWRSLPRSAGRDRPVDTLPR